MKWQCKVVIALGLVGLLGGLPVGAGSVGEAWAAQPSDSLRDRLIDRLIELWRSRRGGGSDPGDYPGDLGLTAEWYDGQRDARSIADVNWPRPVGSETVALIDWSRTNRSFWDGGPNDRFAARIRGGIVIPETGLWSFALTSDDSAALWINEELVINDEPSHGERTRTATVYLTEGLHAIEIRHLERTGNATLQLAWREPRRWLYQTVPTDAFRVMPIEEPEEGTGLTAYWYERIGALGHIDQVDWESPVRSEVIQRLWWVSSNRAWEPGLPADQFAIRLVGSIDVPESGVWTFNLGSDDGAQILVGDEIVVEDPGLHAFRWRSGRVRLEAGVHPFEVRLFERGGWAGVIATWQGPSDAFATAIDPLLLRAESESRPERMLSWSEIGRDETEMARRGVPLGRRGIAARRAGNLTLERYLELLREQGADEAMIRRLSEAGER